MSTYWGIAILIMTTYWGATNIYLRAEHREVIIAAIEDNGCASYQPPAPRKKTNIEAYNLDSLRSDG